MLYYLFVIGCVSLIILLHELGHYLVARALGIAVDVFSVGLGRSLISYKVGATEFRLNWLPLGGYVKLKTELNNTQSDNYLNASWSKKTLILLAGPLANLLLAIALLTTSFQMGVTEYQPIIQKVESGSVFAHAGIKSSDVIVSINGLDIETLNNAVSQLLVNFGSQEPIVIRTKRQSEHIIDLSKIQFNKQQRDILTLLGIKINLYSNKVDSIIERSPASLHDIRPGDIITRINNVAVDSWKDIKNTIVNMPNQQISIQLQRDKTIQTVNLKLGNNNSSGFLGIVPVENTYLYHNSSLSFSNAFLKSFKSIKDFIVFNSVILKKLILGELPLAILTGPIGIAQIINHSMQSSIADFLYIIGMINTALFFFNLLPIPGLDGSLILLNTIESILTRERFNLRLQSLIIQIGIVFMIVIAFQVTVYDILLMYPSS